MVRYWNSIKSILKKIYRLTDTHEDLLHTGHSASDLRRRTLDDPDSGIDGVDAVGPGPDDSSDEQQLEVRHRPFGRRAQQCSGNLENHSVKRRGNSYQTS